MQLKEYIQGSRHGKEANRLEREAMRDPFLQDALEGFDAVQGNHAEVIERLEKRFANPAVLPSFPLDSPSSVLHESQHAAQPAAVQKNRKRLFFYGSVAASILLLTGIGTAYFLFERNDIVMYQSHETNREMPDIPQSSVMDEATESTREMLAKAEEPAAVTPPKPAMQAKAPAPDTNESNLKVKAGPITEHQAEDFSEKEDGTIAAEAAQNEVLAAANAELVEQANGVTAQRKDVRQVGRSRSAPIADEDESQKPFGEKEFQAYCRQKADNSVCGSRKASVKVSFFIDGTGKPTNIKYRKYTCDDARKEVEKLLSTSPAWTTSNIAVTMTVRW